MPKALGIGGLFFRAKAPDELSQWYETHFEICKTPADYVQPVWVQERGETVFAPFAPETEYFGRPEQQWMLNLRVADLEAAVSELQAAGIEVELDPKRYPNGRFARLADPEGNPIELWQPMEPE